MEFGLLQVYPLLGFERVSKDAVEHEKSSLRDHGHPSEDSYRLPEDYQQLHDHNNHACHEQNQIDNLTFSHGYAPFIACTP